MAASGVNQPHAITGGVAEALIATAAGLAVAIGALVPYNYFFAGWSAEPRPWSGPDPTSS